MLGAMTSGENKTTSNDEMLCRAIGMDSAAENDLSIYMIASSDFQPGSLEKIGARCNVRRLGHRMILLEDIGWQQQVAKEVDRLQPDLLVVFFEGLGDCTEFSPTAQSRKAKRS